MRPLIRFAASAAGTAVLITYPKRSFCNCHENDMVEMCHSLEYYSHHQIVVMTIQKLHVGKAINAALTLFIHDY